MTTRERRPGQKPWPPFDCLTGRSPSAPMDLKTKDRTHGIGG